MSSDYMSDWFYRDPWLPTIVEELWVESLVGSGLSKSSVHVRELQILNFKTSKLLQTHWGHP